MIYIISLVAGVLVTLIAVMMMTKTVNQAMLSANNESEKDVIQDSINKIEDYVGKMHHSFYEVSNDLEKRFDLLQESVHTPSESRMKKVMVSDEKNDVNKGQIHKKISIAKQRELVKSLTDEGLTSSEIAKLLGMGKGEVNLLLNIKK